MIIYMDGSSFRVTRTQKQNDWLLSWGIVAHHGDATTEMHGCVTDVNVNFSGHHETVAFAEAIKHAKQLNVPFEDVMFVTDDEWIVLAANELKPRYPGYLVDADLKIRNRLKTFAKKFYSAEMYDDLLNCLSKARFTKVKAHKDVVYNLRVDYLATKARKHHMGDVTQLLSFEQWLARGHRYFNIKKNDWDVWHSPFSNLEDA